MRYKIEHVPTGDKVGEAELLGTASINIFIDDRFVGNFESFRLWNLNAGLQYELKSLTPDKDQDKDLIADCWKSTYNWGDFYPYH